MKKLFFVVTIMSYFFTNCNSNRHDSIKESIEQKAWNFFVDSLLHKNVFAENEIVIEPYGFDEIWVTKGFLYNSILYSDFVSDTISYPYHDELTLKSQGAKMTDSVFQEADYFMKYYLANKEDISPISLINSSDFDIDFDSYFSFLRRKSPNDIFIHVMKKIESKKNIMVRIKFNRYAPDTTEQVDFSLIVFFNLEGKVTHWIFQ